MPYWQDDTVTLWHGDCRELTEWTQADVLLTDPPYGISWRTGEIGTFRAGRRVAPSRANSGIVGDDDTSVRDEALALWSSSRPAAVFGALTGNPPKGTRQTLIYRKPPDAGMRGATAGFQRDAEAIYLIGPWPSGIGGRSSILGTSARTVGNPTGLAARHGHPHAKPVDVLAAVLGSAPNGGLVADPFAGSGSTAEAARLSGRKAVLVELDERYCELIARRLSQGVLDVEVGA